MATEHEAAVGRTISLKYGQKKTRPKRHTYEGKPRLNVVAAVRKVGQSFLPPRTAHFHSAGWFSHKKNFLG